MRGARSESHGWLCFGQLGVVKKPLRYYSLVAYLNQATALYRLTQDCPRTPCCEDASLLLGYDLGEIGQLVIGIATYPFDDLPHARQIIGEALLVNRPGIRVVQLVGVCYVNPKGFARIRWFNLRHTCLDGLLLG